MSLLTLFLPRGVKTELQRNIKLIANHQYRLTFKVRSTVAQNIRTIIEDHTQTTTINLADKDIPANIWTQFKVVFTPAISDETALLRIRFENVSQNFWVDDFKMYDLTKEMKAYRVMRIKGSIFPGTFIQTLTLREKTDNENS